MSQTIQCPECGTEIPRATANNGPLKCPNCARVVPVTNDRVVEPTAADPPALPIVVTDRRTARRSATGSRAPSASGVVITLFAVAAAMCAVVATAIAVKAVMNAADPVTPAKANQSDPRDAAHVWLDALQPYAPEAVSAICGFLIGAFVMYVWWNRHIMSRLVFLCGALMVIGGGGMMVGAQRMLRDVSRAAEVDRIFYIGLAVCIAGALPVLTALLVLGGRERGPPAS
jgi:hypothetical protein